MRWCLRQAAAQPDSGVTRCSSCYTTPVHSSRHGACCLLHRGSFSARTSQRGRQSCESPGHGGRASERDRNPRTPTFRFPRRRAAAPSALEHQMEQDAELREGSSPAPRVNLNVSRKLLFVTILVAILGTGISGLLKVEQSRGARNVDSLESASSGATGTSIPPKFFRSSYHFQPPKNWLNDPNGPAYYKGFYHVFYQYNPGGATWGNLTWGHAVSEDLIHWLDIQPALENDHWYDNGGVWSGSVTIRPDGSPIIVYTGKQRNMEETQNVALPEDASDPYLRKWVKIPENPILKHPEGVRIDDFRDPSTAWQLDDGSWRMTVGTQYGTNGTALLYRSDDLVHWELMENVLHTIPETGMWECLDFYPVPCEGKNGLDTSVRGPSVKHVLKVSAFDTKRDYYAVGSYDVVTEAFTPINQELDAIYALQFDEGKFYASKSFYDPVKQRRINWGWTNESDTEAHDIAKGWASLLAIPRTVWLDSELGDNLIQAPVEELKSLRGTEVSKTEVELEAGSIVKIEGSSGGQLDLEVTFKYPDVSKVGMDDGRHRDNTFDCSNGGSAQGGTYGPFGLLVMADDALQEQTALFFYISQSKDGRWATYFCSDQSRSTLLEGVDSSAFWGNVRVLPTEDFLSLRVLVDHSIIENFVQGGRMAITSRVYPTKAVDEQAHVFLFNNGSTHITVKRIDVWQMKSVHVLKEFVLQDTPLVTAQKEYSYEDKSESTV